MAERVTRLVEQAFNEVARLPAQEQDSFAQWMLEELSERAWQHPDRLVRQSTG
jgi:hypothetical protein